MSENWRFLATRLAESFVFLSAIGVALVWTLQLRGVPWRRWLDQFANPPRRAMLCVGLVTLMVATAVQWFAPVPPEIHDEFSNLLLADTLVHGRFSNPTHSLWRHFESFHVLQQPSYASKYPPALGVCLAIGRLLSGSAGFGVAMLHAAAAAALVWMLQSWTSRRWALIGGLLFATLAPIQIEWSRSFMGGGAAILGACLVLGAVKRLRFDWRAKDAVILAVGLVILANSRPFEGFVFAVTCLTWLATALLRRVERPAWGQVARVVTSASLVLAAGALLMASYCYSVTGNYLKLPYVEYQRQYALTPLFVWQADPKMEREYGNPQFAQFYQYFEKRFYDKQQDLGTFASFKSLSLGVSLLQLVNPTLVLVIGLASLVLFDRRLALPWFLLAIQAATSITAVWLQETYIAPMVAPLFVLAITGLRRVSVWRRASGQGNAIAIGAAVSHGLAFMIALAFAPYERVSDWSIRREKIRVAMEQSGEKHLIAVAYSANHNPHMEWVYNGADLENGNVIWARFLDESSNARLFQHYSDRRQWILLADKHPPELIPLRQSVGGLTNLPQNGLPFDRPKVAAVSGNRNVVAEK